MRIEILKALFKRQFLFRIVSFGMISPENFKLKYMTDKNNRKQIYVIREEEDKKDVEM